MFDRNVTPMDIVMYLGLAVWLYFALSYAGGGGRHNVIGLVVTLVSVALIGVGRLVAERLRQSDGKQDGG